MALAAMFCPSAPASAAARLTVESGGVARHAGIVLRDRLKLRRRPVIIVLSRATGPSFRGQHWRGLQDAASNAPIFVYPEPLNGAWPVKPGPEADRDLKFLRDLLQHVIAQGGADAKRIYLVGVSSGGAFAYRAACSGVGHPLAGLATLISAMPDDLANCAPPTPMAYISISGQADPRVPYTGGPATLPSGPFNALPAEATLDIFAKIDACAGKREEKPIPDKDKHDGSRAFILTYAGCKAPVQLIRVEGGGHRIPGHKSDLGEAEGGGNFDFDGDRAVWEFFKHGGA